MFERTFFITTVTSSRKPLRRSVRLADLFIQTMYEYRRQGKLLVHEWQPGFDNHRIRDQGDYETHKVYIHMNPVRARLVATLSEYAYYSAHPGFELDPPTAAKAGALGTPETHG